MKENSDAYASDKRVNFLFNDSRALIEGDHETCGEVGGVSRYCGYNMRFPYREWHVGGWVGNGGSEDPMISYDDAMVEKILDNAP
jgi:hypothetical protein